MHRLLILSGVLAFAACGPANDNPPPAAALELTGRVVDAADILASEHEESLTDRLAALESDTGVQLVVATTPSLDGRKIEEYSLELARAWALGDSQRHDGVLVLIAPNERKVRIEVGYGLEASVSDPFAAEVIQQMMPDLAQSDFSTATTVAVDCISEKVRATTLRDAA